jgi:hypothetical protein
LTQIENFHNKLNLPTWLAILLTVISSLAVLLLFALLAQYAHPSSDDFCMASGVNDEGLMPHLWNHYFEWSGRYSGNFLYAVYPVIFGLFEGYKFIPAIVLLALFLAAAFCLSRLFSVGMFARPVLLFSLCFVSTFMLGMMSPASSLYWMAGAFSYQTANILLLVILGLMAQLYDCQKRDQPRSQQQLKRVITVLLVLLPVIIIAMGANETSMLALSGLAVIGVMVHLRSGVRVLMPWLLILAITLFCFTVVYLSPGNTIRAADFPLRHDVMRSIDGSLSVGLKVLLHWLADPLLLVTGLLTPFVVTAIQQQSGRSLPASRAIITGLAIFTFIMPFVMQFPAWWSMGGWPPPRTVDAIYFLFLTGWYSTIAAVTLYYLAKGRGQVLKAPYRQASIIVLLLLSMIYAGTSLGGRSFQLAWHDMFERAGPYHEYLIIRYQQIEQAKANGFDALLVPDYMLELPRTIFFNDIMKNPEHWRNECYADYFGLTKIRRVKSKGKVE